LAVGTVVRGNASPLQGDERDLTTPPASGSQIELSITSSISIVI